MDYQYYQGVARIMLRRGVQAKAMMDGVWGKDAPSILDKGLGGIYPSCEKCDV